MEQKNVFYARLGVVVKRGQAYCVFCPKRINKAFDNTQGGGSHASLSNTHKKHFKVPLAENVELALHGVVQDQRAGWRCVPCGVPLHPQGLQFHLATGEHTTEMQRWDVNMEDNISCKKRKSQDELSPGRHDLPEDFLPPDIDDGGLTNEELFGLFNEGVVAMEEEADSLLPWDAEVDFGHNGAAAFQPLQPFPDFAPAPGPGPAQAEATYVSSAPHSTWWDWIMMLLHLYRRVDTLEVRFNQLERAGPAGHVGGGGGGGNPGSSSGGGGLDPGRHGGQYRGGGGGGQNQDKGAGGDQGDQGGGGGGSVCLSFTYTLMLAPTLLAWLHDPKKTATVLFVVAVAVLVATWRSQSLVLQSPVTSTNQSLATTASRESSPAAGTVEELPRPTKDPVLVECKKRPGSAWDRLDRSDSSKYRLYAQCA